MDAEGRRPLSFACELGDAALVKALLDAGAEISGGAEDEESPLMKACEAGHEAVGQLFIYAWANANESASRGMRPLMIAAR